MDSFPKRIVETKKSPLPDRAKLHVTDARRAASNATRPFQNCKKVRELTTTATNRLQIQFRRKSAKSFPRRTKYDVWAEILKSCAKMARTQSWLLVKLRLTTTKVKDSIDFLATAKLIETVEEPNVGATKYKTTEKGQQALKVYHRLITRYFSIDRWPY